MGREFDAGGRSAELYWISPGNKTEDAGSNEGNLQENSREMSVSVGKCVSEKAWQT